MSSDNKTPPVKGAQSQRALRSNGRQPGPRETQSDTKIAAKAPDLAVDSCEIWKKLEAQLAENNASWLAQAQKQSTLIVKNTMAEYQSRLDLSDSKILLLEKDMEAVLRKQDAMQEEIKQLKGRLDNHSSQTCSTSQANNAPGPDGSCPSPATLSGQWAEVASRVARLTDCKMQDMDLADKEARKTKELNAVLRNFEQEEEETSDSLQVKVDELLGGLLETSVVCVSAKRMQKARNGTAPGIVVVQFEKKQHKIDVFKARGKLAPTKIGLDDDLTHLQQQRKNAAWSDFKDFRSKGVRTQWRAEKLFVKKGEHFVEHKVLSL